MTAQVSLALGALLLGLAGWLAPRPAEVMVGGTYPRIPQIRRDELARLRPEFARTLGAIERDGPFPFQQDDTVFTDVQGDLPPMKRDGYREYTVTLEGAPDRGARRVVTGGQRGRAPREYSALYFSDDHYATYFRVVPAANEAAVAAPRLKWRAKLPKPGCAAPVLTRSGRLVVGDEGPTVRALEVGRGSEIWKVCPEDAPRSLFAPARGPEQVVVGTMTFDRDRVWGPLLALDAATGRQRWRFEAGGAFPEPAIEAPDGRLLVTSFYLDTMWFADTLHALEPDSGRELWKADGLEASINALACGPDGSAFVTGFQLAEDGTRLHGLDRAGRESWQTTLRRDSDGYAPLAVDAEGVVYTGGKDHELLAIRPGKGVSWRLRLSQQKAAFLRVLEGDRLAVCSYGGGKRALEGIDPDEHISVWTNAEKRWAPPFQAVAGGTLLCGENGEPALHAVSGRDGHVLWSYPLPSLPVGVAAGPDRTVYVACRGGEVLALSH